MPWCAGCDRFLSPSTVTPTGECPRCGASVDPGRGRAPTEGETPAVAGPPTGAAATAEVPLASSAPSASASSATPTGDEETPLPIPWHFKLLVGAIALYLGWRAFQGVEWVIRQF